MATVYRKRYTMPLPPQAQIVEEFGQMLAKWTDKNGKKHTDQVTVGQHGQVKILRYAPTYLAQYRLSCRLCYGCSQRIAAARIFQCGRI